MIQASRFRDPALRSSRTSFQEPFQESFRAPLKAPPLRLIVALLLIGIAGSPIARATGEPDASRSFEFRYETIIGPIPKGEGPVHVFVPLAAQSEQQRVVSEEVKASIPGSIEVEDAYGNRYWHGSIAVSDGSAIRVSVRTLLERRVFHREAPQSSEGVGAAEREEFAEFLASNARVAVGHPLLRPILAEVRVLAGSTDPVAVARAIYDWVVDNVEYKKVGTGWGNGDTFWACNERYGNCTDFHALFISLARTEGIPARFEIGFPVPDDRPSGEVDGYHCWVEFYLPETGWIPIDASEAFKHPEKRQLFYGTHPADRIHYTTGRDLRLGDAHRGPPLNYFVYPHVEVGGERYAGPIERSFSYEDRVAREAPKEMPEWGS